ncbi:MAG: hypothetical protein EPO36_14165 [Chloroflexota bacterium]|nr:MAG: hypothetical protein EPO36_14165 [Chloroflexota bacterium]
MPAGVIGGLLGAAFAAVAEVLVLTGLERPATPSTRSLRVIAAAFVAGQAVLGLVVAMLSAAIGGGTIPLLVEFASAGMLGLGSFGVALVYRGHATHGPHDDEVRARSRTILLMALADAVGILGAVLAILSLFLAEG